MRVSVIIAAAGRGLRLGGATPKQLLSIGGRSLLTRSIEACAADVRVTDIVVVAPAEHVVEVRAHVPPLANASVQVVAGGPRRQDSVACGLRAVSPLSGVILVHDAARAFVPHEVVSRTIDAASAHGAAIAALPARDTVKRARPGGPLPIIAGTLPREEIYLAQTPQGFRREVLDAAVALGESGVEATDEARLAEMAGFDVVLVEGDPRNLKVTTAADLELAGWLAASGTTGGPMPVDSSAEVARDVWRGPPAPFRIGFGYDSHRFVTGRPLVLGGVRVPFDRGLSGHSDADAVAHAVTDAVLGAAALGDIGQLFPDTDGRWKDADSLVLLEGAVERVHASGFRVANVDVTVIAERPKLGPHRDQMRSNLARVLQVSPDAVGIKGKTNEGMDATGHGEGVAVHAVALIVRG